MSTSSFRHAATAGLLVLTAGHAPPPEFGPTPPPVRVSVVSNGAIYQAAYGYTALTSGGRAGMVGDILTITLVERMQATKATSQTTGRDSAAGFSPPATGPLSLFAPSDLKMSGSQSFKGQGQAAQSNALSGEISVTVAAVYPNGTMFIRGEKQVTLNRGDETVHISGLVRPIDIGPDNRVPSSRVADARISYTGKGEVARASTQGWLQRFFSKVSPF